jgi:DNA-binding XRE family transcriptional regulator
LLFSVGIDEITDNFISQIQKDKERKYLFWRRGKSPKGVHMGKREIERPERLAEKLLRVRRKLGLSQAKMGEALGQHGVKRQGSSIRAYEKGDRVSPPLVALAYARLAKVSLDLLIDDERDLPKGF